MIPFPLSKSMTADQVVAATGALLRVARVDAACTVEEVALIRAFYEAFGVDQSMPAFASLLDGPSGMPFKGDALLADAEQREFVLGACVMVAYADGRLTAAERGAIRDVGIEIGVSEQRIGEIVGIVQDHLLSQLAHLPDAASLVKVAQELG